MEALQIYKSLSQPPKSALREIQAGNLKGKTDINPQWRYEAMTETFGLVGIGWKYEVQKLWTEAGAQGETLAFAQVAVFIRDQDTKEWSEPIVGIGGSKLTQAFSKGLSSNDEGYKMAVTDAFSTSLKMLGVAADIYAGKWDGSKYKDIPETKMSQEAEAERRKEMAPKGPKGGPDTKEQRETINLLFSSQNEDLTPLFSSEDVKKFGAMRNNITADELIELLKAEAEARRKPVRRFEESAPAPKEPAEAENPDMSGFIF